MRQVRSLGVFLAATVVAVALANTATASAAENTVICKADEVPCKEANIEDGVKFAGQSENVEASFTYLGAGLVLACNESELDESFTTEAKGNPRLPGYINHLKFSGCKVGSTACTVAAQNLRWKFLLAHKAGGGWLTVTEESEWAFPSVHVECGSLINCTYIVSDLDEDLPGQYVAHLEVTNGASLAQIHAHEVRLVMNGGFNCTVKEVTINATYVLSHPEPLWVSYVE